MRSQSLIVIFHALLFASTGQAVNSSERTLSASPPATTEEVAFNAAVANFEKKISSGEAERQIAAGQITADTIQNNLDQWLLTRNYVNQNSAIDLFADAFGKTEAPAPDDTWFNIALTWTGTILGLIGEPVGILSTGLTIFSNGITTLKAATKARVATPGANAAELVGKWKADLPNQRSSLGLTIQQFVEEIRKDGSHEKLLAAYKVHIKMIKGSGSPRSFFNQYYSGYYQGTTKGGDPNTNFVAFHVNHEEQPAPGGGRRTVLTSSYFTTVMARHPKGLDGCHITKKVMEVNEDYITPSNPGLAGTPQGEFKALLTSNYAGSGPAALHSWMAYQFSCADLTSPEGMIDVNQNFIGRRGYIRPEDKDWVTLALRLPYLRSACAQYIQPKSTVAALPFSDRFFCDGCFHATDFGGVLQHSKCSSSADSIVLV